MTQEIRLKRIYDEPNPDDGLRVFVDRLWARGVSKEAAKIDVWAKELTPSNELRKWFHEDRSQIEEFERRYRAELEDRLHEIEPIIGTLREAPVVTLITATKDLTNGHAAVLKSFLEETSQASDAEN